MIITHTSHPHQAQREMHLLSTSPPARFTRTCCGPVRSPSVGDVHGASDAHDEAANGSILDVCSVMACTHGASRRLALSVCIGIRGIASLKFEVIDTAAEEPLCRWRR